MKNTTSTLHDGNSSVFRVPKNRLFIFLHFLAHNSIYIHLDKIKYAHAKTSFPLYTMCKYLMYTCEDEILLHVYAKKHLFQVTQCAANTM